MRLKTSRCVVLCMAMFDNRIGVNLKCHCVEIPYQPFTAGWLFWCSNISLMTVNSSHVVLLVYMQWNPITFWPWNTNQFKIGHSALLIYYCVTMQSGSDKKSL